MPRGGAVSSCGARTAGEVNRQARRHACRVTRARRTKWTRARVPRPRGGARPTPMRCGRQRIRSTPTHLRVQHRVQRGGAHRVRRHASAGGFFAGPNQRSQKAATMSSSSASIACWSRSSPRLGFALRMAASRRRACARTRKVLTPALRRARERRARAASGDGERCSITPAPAAAAEPPWQCQRW